ncbi:MAG: hypothetical protein RL689_1581 [Planctomycetota bacterium]|jgi:hypothetical protein
MARLLTAVGGIAFASSSAHAGFLLESRATFVHLRHIVDGTPVFFTESPARGFRAFASDGLPVDPVITLSELAHYNFTMTSTSVQVTRPGHYEYAGDYEIRFGGYNSPVPPSLVSAGVFAITLTFVDAHNATIAGHLTQDPGSISEEFPDLSYGGHPILVEGEYHHTYHPDGTWSGGGMISVDFRQTAVPSPASLGLLALAALTPRRRR